MKCTQLKFFYLWNYHKMNQISTKGAKIVQNGPKLISSKCIKFVQKGTFEQISKICIKMHQNQICTKRIKLAQNEPKLHKMDHFSSKCIQFAQSGPSLCKMAQKCAKWTEFSQNNQICTK